MRYKKQFRCIAIALAVIITCNSAISGPKRSTYLDILKQKALAKKTESNFDYQNIEPKTALGSFADKVDTSNKKLKTDIESNNLVKLKSDVKEAKKELSAIRKDIDKELSENDSTLQKLNAKNAEERQKKFKIEITSKLVSFQAAFDKIDAISANLRDLKSKETADLKTNIEEINKLLKTEQPQQKLGALPHSDVNVKPSAPATGTKVKAAYLESTTVSTTSSLPVVPTSEDTSETNEAKFTKEITDLADSLKTSINIYEYVRNNVNFEPYYGSRKGAVGTLEQMSGNDFDQDSLLIAMLRYKGIPSRYVRGTVEIPIDQVKGWMGAETAEAAVKSLGSLGMPSTAVVSSGVITSVRIEHVWVEAYVPYENYRGIGEGTGQKIWVPLDPSFKQYTKKQGLDIGQIAGINSDFVKGMIDESGVIKPDAFSATRLSIKNISQTEQESKQKILNYFNDNNIDKASFNDLVGGFEIIPQKLGLLPNTLPYKTISISEEARTIDANYSATVGFSIRGADPYGSDFYGDNDFEFNSTAADLYGKKITLSWIPATSEDEAVINKYGGIFNTPAYLIQLKPVLKIDGQVKAVGDAVGAGYRQEFTIEVKNTGTSPETIVNPVTVGSYYCVGLDYGVISPNELNGISDKMKAIQSSVSKDNIYSDEYMGELLNLISKTYFSQLDAYNKTFAWQQNVKSTRLLSECMTGYNAEVSYIFNSPVELSEGGMYIDVDDDAHSVVSLNGTSNSERAYMRETGMISSYMEHAIFEQLFKIPSVSTIKILQVANATGVPVYTVNKNNASEVIPKLSVDDSVKTDITDAVNSGKVVTIPQRNIQYYNWSGTGYIVMDPDTGAAAYMISGGLAGGSFSIERTLEKLADGLAQMIYIIDLLQICSELAALIVTPWLALAVEVIMETFIYFMMIDFMLETAETIWNYEKNPTGENLEDVLVNLILILLGGFIDGGEDAESDGGKDTKPAEDGYINAAKDLGVPEEVADIFLERFGSEDGALAALKSLIDKGVSTGEIRDIGNCLSKEGIQEYIDIINDYSGEYTDADYASIYDILKQCATVSEMSELRSDINQLDEDGIKPSDYQSEGIDTPEEVKGAAEASVKIIETLETEPESIFEYVTETTDKGDYIKFKTADGIETEIPKSKLTEAQIECLENGCFTGETLVETSTGLRRIDSLNVGDLVLSENPKTGTEAFKKVLTVYKKTTNELYILNVAGEKITTTSGHLFMISNRLWKSAKNIHVGDKIINADGSLKDVKNIEVKKSEDYTRIYNLKVEDYHTYFVGNDELLVHNNCLSEMMAAGREAIEDAKACGVTDANELSEIGEFAADGARSGYIGSDGKFIDEKLEADYQKYVARKEAEGKQPREDRTDWKDARDYFMNDSPLARGNNFNNKAVNENWYPYNEVNLNISESKRVVLDSYDPVKGEIVSRKATDLEEIQLSTFEGYLREMKYKYKPGTVIRSNKYPQIDGQILEGKQILEIPASNESFSQIQEYTDLAKSKYDIEIRFREE